MSEAERRAGGEIAGALSMGALSRAWTLIMAGYADVKDSPRPLASLDMALVKLAYAADLPGPEEALRKISESGGVAAAPRLAPPPSAGGPRASAAVALAPAAAPPATALRLSKFEDVVALARSKRDVALVRALEHDMRVARFEPGRIEFTPVASAHPTLSATLGKKLSEWTGERWMIVVAQGATAPTLRETANAKEDEKREGAAAHPVVRKVMEQFPGARIVAVRAPEVQAPEPPPPTDEDVSYSEPIGEDEEF